MAKLIMFALLAMMLLSMAFAYGPEDDDGRGGSNRHHHSSDDNHHGFDGAGHSRQNAGGQKRLLGADGHGQRGYQAGQNHGHGGQNGHSQTHGHNDGERRSY